MPEASLACKRLLLHPLHGGIGRAVPACVTEGLGEGGTWVVNKGLFSLGWESPAGTSGRTGGGLEEAL